MSQFIATRAQPANLELRKAFPALMSKKLQALVQERDDNFLRLIILEELERQIVASAENYSVSNDDAECIVDVVVRMAVSLREVVRDQTDTIEEMMEDIADSRTEELLTH